MLYTVLHVLFYGALYDLVALEEVSHLVSEILKLDILHIPASYKDAAGIQFFEALKKLDCRRLSAAVLAHDNGLFAAGYGEAYVPEHWRLSVIGEANIFKSDVLAGFSHGLALFQFLRLSIKNLADNLRSTVGLLQHLPHGHEKIGISHEEQIVVVEVYQLIHLHGPLPYES